MLLPTWSTNHPSSTALPVTTGSHHLLVQEVGIPTIAAMLSGRHRFRKQLDEHLHVKSTCSRKHVHTERWEVPCHDLWGDPTQIEQSWEDWTASLLLKTYPCAYFQAFSISQSAFIKLSWKEVFALFHTNLDEVRKSSSVPRIQFQWLTSWCSSVPGLWREILVSLKLQHQFAWKRPLRSASPTANLTLPKWKASQNNPICCWFELFFSLHID